MRKKGISEVITVTLMVFLATIMAVTAGLFIPGLAAEDLEVVRDVSVETNGGYTYYDTVSKTAYIQAQMGSDDVEIEKLEFIFVVGGNSHSVFRDYVPDSNEAKVYNFTQEEIGGVPDTVKVVSVYFGKDVEKRPIVTEVKLKRVGGGGSSGGGDSGSRGRNNNVKSDDEPEDIVEYGPCNRTEACNDNLSYTDDWFCYDNETELSNCSNEVVLNITHSSVYSYNVLAGNPIYLSVYAEVKTVVDSVSVYYREVNSSDWIKTDVEFDEKNLTQYYENLRYNSTIYSWFTDRYQFSGIKHDGLDIGEYEFKYVIEDVEGNFVEYNSSDTLSVFRVPTEEDCIELIDGYNNVSEDRINVVFMRGLREGTVAYSGDELRENAVYVVNNSPLEDGRYGGLLQVEPFASNADLFNFWYVAAGDINAWSACALQNRVTVRTYNASGRSSAGLSFYGCSADYQVGLNGFINLENREGGRYASVFVHEIGHAVGGLYDEYTENADNCSIGSQPSFYNFMPNVICINKTFNESEQKAVCEENSFWSNLGLECFKGCRRGKNNCWRASSYSLMRSTTATSFHEVNERYICHILSCKGFDVTGSYCDNLCFGELGYDAKIGKIGCDVGEVCQAGECVNE